LTAQDRLVKQLRLAKVANLQAANAFLEKEYWPEWNERFARPVKDFPNQHRALGPSQELAAILCHVEERVIANDYTFSFASQRYQIPRAQAQAGMRRQRLRVELRLNGELKARYQVAISTLPNAALPQPPQNQSCANRPVKITTPEARVLGCRASLIVLLRRSGS